MTDEQKELDQLKAIAKAARVFIFEPENQNAFEMYDWLEPAQRPAAGFLDLMAAVRDYYGDPPTE